MTGQGISGSVLAARVTGFDVGPWTQRQLMMERWRGDGRLGKLIGSFQGDDFWI